MSDQDIYDPSTGPTWEEVAKQCENARLDNLARLTRKATAIVGSAAAPFAAVGLMLLNGIYETAGAVGDLRTDHSGELTGIDQEIQGLRKAVDALTEAVRDAGRVS